MDFQLVAIDGFEDLSSGAWKGELIVFIFGCDQSRGQQQYEWNCFDHDDFLSEG